MENDAHRIIDFIVYAEKLKTETRNALKSDDNRESVAEHCWRVSLFLVLVIPKLTTKIDPLKILKMATIHDLVEIEAKDVSVLETIDNNNKIKSKQIKELDAMEKIKKILGEEADEINALWLEYEENETNESRVLKVIDRLEAQLQFLSDGKTRISTFDQVAITKLLEETAKMAKIDPFLEVLDKETLESRKERVKY